MDHDEEILRELKTLLMEEEIVSQQAILEELERLKKLILDHEQFGAHLDPYLEAKITYLRDNFPRLFGAAMSEAIKIQVRDSQDEIIDALYPIIGKLIVKYLKSEIERINERIDKQLQNTFSLSGIWRRFKALFTGVSYEDMMMKDAVANAAVEEIFVINKEAGLLLAHHSLNNLMNPDMIAGMLTGIKGFIEHAFLTGEQQLETLEYESHEIVVHNFRTFYIAALLSGYPSAEFKSKLHASVNGFCEDHRISPEKEVTRAEFERLSEALKTHFYGFNQVDK